MVYFDMDFELIKNPGFCVSDLGVGVFIKKNEPKGNISEVKYELENGAIAVDRAFHPVLQAAVKAAHADVSNIAWYALCDAVAERFQLHGISDSRLEAAGFLTEGDADCNLSDVNHSSTSRGGLFHSSSHNNSPSRSQIDEEKYINPTMGL